MSSNIEPCLGTGHSLSVICQPTSEDMKLYIIINKPLIVWRTTETVENEAVVDDGFIQ